MTGDGLSLEQNQRLVADRLGESIRRMHNLEPPTGRGNRSATPTQQTQTQGAGVSNPSRNTTPNPVNNNSTAQGNNNATLPPAQSVTKKRKKVSKNTTLKIPKLRTSQILAKADWPKGMEHK